jgi:putative nucleotidyltransferase with HDIG domain
VKRSIRTLRLAQALLTAGALTAAALLSAPDQWHPVALVVGLLLFALISEPVPLYFKGLGVSGGFLSVAVAVVVAGVAPAMLIGVITMVSNAVRRRAGVAQWLPNVSIHAGFPLVGAGLLALVPAHVLHDPDVLFIPVVAGVFLVMNIVNFLYIAVDVAVADGAPSVPESVRHVYADAFPAELASSVLCAMVAYAYMAYGTGALLLLGLVVLSFQYLIRMALDAARRKAEVEERNNELAALQMGLISTTLKTLALRDHMTARHSAAVARYAREMAAELKLEEREQDLIHTAALFHDIGKFIFPDSILLSSRGLTEEEFEIVRRHPVVGAELIAEIDGYGPVAEIVRWHHERIDGLGYPDRISGPEIPLGSRIIAVADIYDVITSRDTYRTPVSIPEAFAELRRVAGTQLDADLVELFIGIVQRRGVHFRHATAADFEAELALPRRVSAHARPRAVAA